MRRSTAISQLVLLLAFYAVPLLASSNVALPACCRRDGAHHCAMMAAVATGQTTFHNPVHCPYRFPTSILTHATKLFLAPGSASENEVIPRPRAMATDGVGILFRSATPLDNRGPPALTL
jgi:hypothetical protein